MKLKALFKGIEPIVWKGDPELDISSISSHSKNVVAGSLFFAKKGMSGEGYRFISEAVVAGAVAVLTDTYNPFLSQVTQIIHDDPSRLELLLGRRFYRNPTKGMWIVGITGSSGKTTVSFLIREFFFQMGIHCGVIGSIIWETSEKSVAAALTTPDLLTSLNLFHEMKKRGCKSAVMEVSSIGIHQQRVDGIPFTAGIFTNLSHEHLDYHHTMEEYVRVKSSWFKGFSPDSFAILNGDDPYASIVESCCQGKILRYGLNKSYDLYASSIELSLSHMQFKVHWKGEIVIFRSHLIGHFNVYNILAATAASLLKGLTLTEIGRILERFRGVPGRLERVENERGLHIFVDYSHKPDALERVLQTLFSLKKRGRLITVFGCGGERDKSKRPLMASIAEKFSHFSILTNDNPRHEDPEKIIAEITEGFQNKRKFSIQQDRKRAISDAIKMAKAGDLVLIAGKGHETYQILGNWVVPFDDREIVKEICKSTS